MLSFRSRTVVMALAGLAWVGRCHGQDGQTDKCGVKPADLAKPVQVYLLLGQSNMVGLGKVSGPAVSLESAVKERGKYKYLVDAAGQWGTTGANGSGAWGTTGP